MSTLYFFFAYSISKYNATARITVFTQLYSFNHYVALVYAIASLASMASN
jgi:hypothetical protein